MITKDDNRRTNLENYHPAIRSFVTLLRAKLAEADERLRFEIDIPGSYPEHALELSLWSSLFKPHHALLEVSLDMRRNKAQDTPVLCVDYRSDGRRRRDVRVLGTEAEQVAKLVHRALARHQEAIASSDRQKAENAAAQARKARFYADFTGPDGKLLVPLDFAYAYRTPGEYSLNTNISEALRNSCWHKDEVLKLVAVLKEVRAAMKANGRLVEKEETND